ncbi:auxin-responsive protein SAUR23-like [Silene latifolia]|uniref:auxin-responsive protein SAUR23-like n=1 Tax=Silene latifolia TaxID=37657 RepID=UPI003D77E088
MDSKGSNKIIQIVKLHQILKKWRKLANASAKTNNKSIKFLKKTLSFSENSVCSIDYVPKGYLAICVGKEQLKRYVIPTHYLSHQSFQILLNEAEEEFGFQQEGVLKLPCEIAIFDKILKVLHFHNGDETDAISSDFSECCSPDVTDQPYPQLCR